MSINKSNDNNNVPESLEEQLEHATEELITGDSDDPPLSEETVIEMLRVACWYGSRSM